MSAVKESPCPDCGEMVRVNSLRCWNCGGFMNKKIEEDYLALQAKPQEVIYSQLPESEVSALEDEDDDFELSTPVAAKAAVEPGEAKVHADATKPGTNVDSGTEVDLLNIALEDEREIRKRQQKRRQKGGMKLPGGGFMIFCPYGCRIEVKEAHRGMQGKCPKCRAPFVVPTDPPDYSKKKSGAEAEAAASGAGGFDHWIGGLHLHTVNPEKLKLKADSLVKDFVTADFAFSKEKLLAAVYGKKSGGLFGGGGANDPREALKAQLREGKPIAELDLAQKFAYEAQRLSEMKVVQPAASRADSIFHGIPVFGAGRIAVQLPHIEDSKDLHFVSMGITQFWEFRKQLEENFGISNFGADTNLPTKPEITTYRCQYLEIPIKALKDVELYQSDDSVELETVGFECEKCHATVSMQGRDQHQLGGKTPKGIAKAKCPKCQNKMGEHPLFMMKEKPVEAVKTALEDD